MGCNRPISQIPECICVISHNASFCNRNVHMCAHFCYKMVHCGIFFWSIVGFVRWIYYRSCLYFHSGLTEPMLLLRHGWVITRFYVDVIVYPYPIHALFSILLKCDLRHTNTYRWHAAGITGIYIATQWYQSRGGSAQPSVTFQAIDDCYQARRFPCLNALFVRLYMYRRETNDITRCANGAHSILRALAWHVPRCMRDGP